MNTAMSAKRLAKFWWIVAVVFSVLWLIIWLSTDKERVNAKPVSESESKTLSDLVLPKKIDALGDFNAEVAPLSAEAIKQDLRIYSKEFKDKEFFEKNKHMWTVQIMDVTTHENITNYLDIRKDKYQDRDKFYYFRYVDGSSKEHYVLIYDLFKNRVMANGVWNERDKRFDLPKDVPIVVKPIKDYLQVIDSYVREEEDESVNIPKDPAVALKETDKQVKARPAKDDKAKDDKNRDDKTKDNKAKDDKARKKTDEAVERTDGEENDTPKKAKAKKEAPKDADDKPKPKELAEPPVAKPTREAKKSQAKKAEEVKPDPATVVTLEDDGGMH